MKLLRLSILAALPLALWACEGKKVTTPTGSGGSTTGTDTGAQGGGGAGAQGGGGAGGAQGGGGGGGAQGGGGAGGGIGGAPSDSLFDLTFGSPADDAARGVAVDSAGDAVIAAAFTGDIDVAGQGLSSQMTDILLAKIDTTGGLVWVKQFGTALNDRPVAVDVTAQGQILVAGSFLDVGGSFGGQPYGGTGPQLAKLAADGTHIWSKPWGLNGSGSWGTLTADPDGSVWATGAFNGTVNFGAGQVSSTGTLDLFVAHVDTNGGLIDLFVKAGDVTVRGQAPDGKGGLYLAGSFKGTLDLGAGPLTTLDPMAAESFFCRLDANGVAAWSKKLPGIVQRVAVDGVGDAVVTGYFAGTADFGTGQLVSAGGDDAFVFKASSDGAVAWATKLGSTSSDAGRAVAVDAAGDIVMTGFFNGAPDFGMGPLMVGMGRNVLVVKLDADGQVLGAKGFGGDGTDEGLHVAVDALGAAFVYGEYDMTATFGSTQKTPVGMKDLFLLKTAF